MAQRAVPRYNLAVLTQESAPDDDKFHEECALFGIYGTSDAAAHTALGLHALQHRGQEASGIVTYDGRRFHDHRAAGLVGDIFGEQSVIARLKGYCAIGHNRYATTGGSSDRNIQPIFADFDFGGLALAHNGNLTNAYILRKELVRMGCLFQSTTDTEVINHLIARSNYSTLVDRMIDALGRVKGAYSLLLLTNEALLGVRDPMGVRPLCIGKLDDAWILTSESCGLDILGARFVRDVEPGEIVIVDGTGLRSIKPFTKQQRRFCVFEHIYFARPDSKIEGVGVYEARKRIGCELARESPVPADVIVPVPDSGVPAAIGFSQQSGIPFELGIIRNHYVGRTFIEPADHIRHLGVRLKHNANRALIEGKRIVLVDDLDRARHDLDEDRRDGARCRRQGSAYAHRRAADHRSLLLRHRHARQGQAAGLALRRGRHGQVHRRRSRSLSCRSTACTGRWACRRAATPGSRRSATPASPATTRSRSTT